jgi:hypothetical protein
MLLGMLLCCCSSRPAPLRIRYVLQWPSLRFNVYHLHLCELNSACMQVPEYGSVLFIRSRAAYSIVQTKAVLVMISIMKQH